MARSFDRRARACGVALLLIAGCSPPLPQGPRLGVLVIFDQLRAAELDRYAPFFEGGFGGLEARGGARFDARYTYADTETAPGHATLATGANPRTHGIVSNYWFDNDGKRIYCIDDSTAPVLGTKKNRGSSAKMLKAQTLADTLKLESNGKAHVVALSLKDRAAILTGGRAADFAAWYDADQCAFTTSRAYADELPGWFRWMATELPEKSMKSGTWSPKPVPLGLEALVAFDASPNEAGEMQWKDKFPHDLTSLPDQKSKCVQYRASPQSLHDLFQMARVAVESRDLELGDDVVPDLLVVSVSTTDYVGHGWGPQSLEYLEILRQADEGLRNFVHTLDYKLGPGGYVIAVSSDHASTPVAEVAVGLGLEGGRIPVEPLRVQIEEAVERAVERYAPKAARPEAALAKQTDLRLGRAARLGPHMIAKDVKAEATTQPVYAWLKGFAPPHVYLDIARFEPAVRRQIQEEVKKAIEATPGIEAAYVVEDGRVIGNDRFVPMYQELVYGERNGAIMIRPKARWVYAFDNEIVGTDHGSPYNYDSTVPFIVSGVGVRGGRYAKPCDVRDVAPTLSFLLKMPAPDHAEGTPVSAVGADRAP